MAPANGHLLLPKMWRAARFAYEKAFRAIRAKLPEPTQHPSLHYQPAYARINSRHPINRVAAIRQARSRYFSTRAAGAFVSALRSGVQADANAYKATRIASNISRLTSRAPFASTLRPNLTGGTLGRTAGGYAVGAGRFGGARYFSHGPAAPAQVIQNVSQGKRYKAVSALQDQASRTLHAAPFNAPGSYVDFQLSPTITALSGLRSFGQKSRNETLNSDGLMDMLSADFARALKDFATVLNDLKRISSLGNLPIHLHDQSTIRVQFPGCDAETVERLCDEVGVQRGRIFQDEDFNLRTGADLALLFPFAPSRVASSDTQNYFETISNSETQVSDDELDWRDMITPESGSPFSQDSARDATNNLSFEDPELFGSNPWNSSRSAYSSINISDLGDRVFFPDDSSAGLPETSSEHDGVEGIYNFLAECDRARF
ncbi:hypothetical protein N7462_000490 [Penicillium macrosclerotiorum]|uniref:uncharacterized protein n=1 Tax=Penicillium macrosclerotiorum TaxID=303699 RepID=UPI002546A430|nr:uncharacterized protein N7462_000490 [Penicillium macrosclerotiorum]KAJ5698485.1 hypothetical protein N7462_000490 [Penicillium macrosclerotiorum]